MGSIADLLANYNPNKFVQDNKLRDQQVAEGPANLAIKQAQATGLQQESQGLELKNQIQQRALRDQDILQKSMTEAANDPDPFAVIKIAQKNGASPQAVWGARKSITDMVNSSMAMDEGKLKLQSAVHDQARSVLETADQAAKDGNLQLANELWAKARGQIAQTDPQDAQHMAGNYDPERSKVLNSTLITASKIAEEAFKRSEAKQKEAQAVRDMADAKLNAAKTPGEEAKAKIEVLKADAMKAALANPQQGEAQIDAALPAKLDANANAAYKAAYKALMSIGKVDEAAELVGKAAAHSAELSKGTSPAVIAGDVAKQNALLPGKIAEQSALLPGEIKKSVTVQRALNSAGNAALADVPPHLATAAVSAYAKSTKELADAHSAAAEMQSIIDLAKSGNKIAYAYAPTTGVLTINTANGVKRVNMAEIQSYGGAGSLVDRIQGYLGKQISGASIPPSVLNDMAELHSQLGKVADVKHDQEVQGINQAYGAKFKPAVLTTAKPPEKKPAAAVQRSTSKSGKPIESADGGATWTYSKQ